MRTLMTISRLPRPAGGAVIALALTLLVAAPAAAAQPIRTVSRFHDRVRHFPAGAACEFDVTLNVPEYRFTTMSFTDGRDVSFGHGIRHITNDATGASIDLRIDAHEVDRWGSVIVGSVTGQSIFTFAVGDAAPDGGVVDHVYSIYIRGKVTYVIDGTTFATLAISIDGSYMDICAAIS
jgi:hypothetical protein